MNGPLGEAALPVSRSELRSNPPMGYAEAAVRVVQAAALLVEEDKSFLIMSPSFS